MIKLSGTLSKKFGEIELRIHSDIEGGKSYLNQLKSQKKSILGYFEFNSKKDIGNIMEDFRKKHSEKASPLLKSHNKKTFYAVRYPEYKEYELKENILEFFSQ
jgi:hypothetical protein